MIFPSLDNLANCPGETTEASHASNTDLGLAAADVAATGVALVVFGPLALRTPDDLRTPDALRVESDRPEELRRRVLAVACCVDNFLAVVIAGAIMRCVQNTK